MMKAYNKIGFHTSVGGNPTGIGDWMKALDAANIPFFIKAADSMTGLFDAQQLIRARQEVGSGKWEVDSTEKLRRPAAGRTNHSPLSTSPAVPHVLVFRRSVHNDQDYDVPDYAKEPEAAAVEHWNRHKVLFPPELDPQLVWIENINELRKEVAWGDWIGAFAYYTGQLALAEGYKYSAFGYSTGTPDEGVWETDGMLRYLELCQQHPDRLSVALHEYSLTIENIWFMRGDLIGRFEKLLAACDKNRIKRPKILITEWGWTHEEVPRDINKAIKDIGEVAEYYARFPEVLGAAMWYLGPGFGGIANLAQRLIKPVTDFTLNTVFDVPDPAEPVAVETRPPMSIMPIALAATAASPTPNARFIRDVTIPDDSRMTVGQIFTKTWRVENNGNVAWTSGYKLVHTAGVPMTSATSQDLPAAAPGQQVDISVTLTVPSSPGVHFSDWRLRDDKGNFFGDIVYTRIVAAPAPAPPAGVSNSRFVADVTIPDDMQIAPGARFIKTWRVRNIGTRAWNSPGFSLAFAGGTAMTGVTSHPLPAVAPGAEANISVEMTAPTAPGTHYGDWRMKDDQGNFFGQIVYVRIVVPAQSGSSLAGPLSQRDPLWADKRLGLAGSPKSIGEWGCLLTCFAMVANTFGHAVTPAQLNDAMARNNGFLDGYLTKWNALSQVYNDVIYEGKVDPRPDMLNLVNASLAAGRPVTVQVDFTNDTPYTDNDQHWVLIVGRDGDDYRINDPWLLPAQEASLRQRYGRSGLPLQNAIMAAIFYRSTRTQPVTGGPEPVEPQAPARLQTGMNINPDAPHSNPTNTDDLKGLDWVRFVFKVDARLNVAERGDLQKAFAQYSPIIRAYHKIGVKSLIILNQETVWGTAPWTGNNDWQGYADQLADVARQIARRYKIYGDKVAYEIWNEGDKLNNPSSVYAPPDKFAVVLKRTAEAIRAKSPTSPIVFGGLATGPEEGIAYLQKVKQALNGPWPVNAIGIHPYTRWATRAPFDWGRQYGTLGDAFARYKQAFPNMPFWITEIGVADDNEIGPQFQGEIGDYMKDVYKHVTERHADQVPVLIWFAWSDWMRNAGVVDRNGQRKPEVYAAFRAVRNREL